MNRSTARAMEYVDQRENEDEDANNEGVCLILCPLGFCPGLEGGGEEETDIG